MYLFGMRNKAFVIDTVRRVSCIQSRKIDSFHVWWLLQYYGLIIRMNETVFQRKWSLEDELKLLNAINNCGYGNWLNISLKVPPFTSEDCEKHYHEKFLHDIDRPTALCTNNCKIRIDQLEGSSFSYANISKVNEYIRRLGKEEFSENVYKCNTQEFSATGLKSNSNKFLNYMVALPYIGYNRVRSDFDIEYDDNAESVLKMISENQLDTVEMIEEESDMFRELEFALYQSYNRRLRRRHFCKKIVRNHCLIDRRKTYNMLQRLDVGFGSTSLKALIPILRFVNGPEFDYLVEKFKYQTELKLKIALLTEYRNNGLKFLNDIDIYKRLKCNRFKFNAELACLSMASDDLKSSTALYNRKTTAPLTLQHLPGYNLLNDDERKLCSTSRIVPETYISFKEVMISECEKLNGLRLAQARNLIKIDVNKIRKIYDYLISLDVIWQPDL